MRTSILVGIPLALLSLTAWAGESNSGHAALSKEAKITMEQAQKTALAKEGGKIQSKEIEREKGRLIYSFDIKMADGIHEVNIDDDGRGRGGHGRERRRRGQRESGR